MRLRTLLTATAASTLAVAGLTSMAALADPQPAQASPGSVVTWGAPPADAPQTVPQDLTGLIVSVAANDRATAVVTADGRLRVWGDDGAPEVVEMPTDITDALSVSLTTGNGAVLREGGRITAWGASAALAADPPSRSKAISLADGTGYSVDADGRLGVFGETPTVAPPALSQLVDVVAAPTHVLALTNGGTVHAWGDPAFPDLATVPSFGGKKVTQIATSDGANGVVLADGTIRVWGPAVPPGQPDLAGQKVVSLDLANGAAGAVTQDGVVHTWGTQAAVNAVPASLAGQPVVAIAMGARHAAAVVAYRVMTPTSIPRTPRVGQTLTAALPSYSLAPASTTGQWYAGLVPIRGLTSPTMTVDDSMVGTLLSFHTTATLDGVTRTSESAPVSPVGRAASTTTLTVSRAKAPAGRTRTATATVTRLRGTPTGTVTFTAGTRTRVVPLSHGQATWTLPPLPAGSHAVTATYSGSPSSDPSTAVPVKLKTIKAVSTVRARATETTTRVQLAVRVRTAGGVSPKGKVTVSVAGRKVTARVDASGRATVAITRVKHGSYTATVVYGGNDSVSGSRSSVTLSV